jgi:hypothetical protein
MLAQWTALRGRLPLLAENRIFQRNVRRRYPRVDKKKKKMKVGSDIMSRVFEKTCQLIPRRARNKNRIVNPAAIKVLINCRFGFNFIEGR